MMKQPTNNASDNLLQPTAALTRFIVDLDQLNVYDAEPEEQKHHGFSLGDMGFLFATNEKAEVVENTSTCSIPNTPLWFKGMINVRGNLVPVVDFGLLLDIKVKNLAEWVLILGAGNKSVGISIDNLPILVDSSKQIEEIPPLPEILQKHNRAAFLHEKRIWLELDYGNFFTDLFNTLES